MGQSYSILIFFCTLLFGCQKQEEEFPDSLPDYYIPLEEAVGNYVYVPHQALEYGRDDFKYLKLTKGDILKLEIKSDSTFVFNFFYHDNAIKAKDFIGKFTVTQAYKDILIFREYPDGSPYHGGTSGFKKGKKTYFYIRLRQPNDKYEYEYEYPLYYEKVK